MNELEAFVQSHIFLIFLLPLEGAVEEELPEYVEEYLVKGANPNVMITDEHEYLQEHELVPAIIYAARHIKPSTILKHLVNHGASVELNINGTTPLIEAAEWGNLSAVKFLLNKGANINATTGSGVTAIGFAILNEDIPMIKLMLKERNGIIDFNYTIFDTNNENVIDDADENAENPEVAKILKKYAIEQKLPIHSYRQKKRLGLGRVMDKKRMPADLTHKIMTEHFGGKKKRKTRRNNKKPRKSNKRFRKTRSKKQKGSGAKCSRPGQCTTDQNMEEEDPNSIHDYLQGAVEEEIPKLVKEYLVKGANPNILILDDDELVPAIIYAARHIKHSAIIMKYLLQYGASVEPGPDTDTTPLIEAAEYGNYNAVYYLLSKSLEKYLRDNGKGVVDINATNGRGATAIVYAVMNEDIRMINLMLNRRKGEIDFNYTLEGLDEGPQNVIDDDDTKPDVARILKKYAIEQQLPSHKIKQEERLQLSNVMKKKRMPPDLTHEIMTKYLGGKRKSKKSKRKTRKTRK